MKSLSASEIEQALPSVPGWRLEGGRLVREFRCPDFISAVALVNRIGELAEAAGHHPDIDIRYNRVVLGLETHDANGITVKDFDMAKAVSGVFEAGSRD